MKAASWVIREKATGKGMFETFDKKKVDALNTPKYETVPIDQYLASLNQRLKQSRMARCQATSSRFNKEASMRVVIEAGPDNGFGLQYRLKMLDGYRAGQFVRNCVTEQPLFDVDRVRLTTWARDTGYEVVSSPMLCDKKDMPTDLAVFRRSRANSPVGEAMRKHLGMPGR